MTAGLLSVSARWGLLGSALTLAAVIALPSNQAAVLVPALLVALIAGWFWSALRERDRGGAAILELGSVYVLVVSLYALYPVVSYVAKGFDFRAADDYRLSAFNPSGKEMGSLVWLHLAYLAAFALIYLLVRGKAGLTPGARRSPGSATLGAVVVVLLTVQGFVFLLYLAYGLRASTYFETYLVVYKLPLVLRQLYNHLQGVSFVCQLFVFTFLFSRFRRFKWIIALWLGVVAAAVAIGGGARTPLVVMCVGAAMLYHVQVKPLRTRTLGVVGGVLLGTFLLLGIARGGGDVGRPILAWNPFTHGSEFDSVFGNAIEIRWLKEIGATREMPAGFAFADLVAVVPQQLLPFNKTSAGTWFMTEFHPELQAEGGGLAFGAIAESVLGCGVVSAVWRGAVIGLIFALVHRRVALGAPTMWAFCLYVWLTVWCYQCFRATTFALIVPFIYQFVVAWLMVTTLSALFMRSPAASARTRSRRGHEVVMPDARAPRVLHLIPTLAEGGAERQLGYLGAELVQRGWLVDVALLRGGPNLERLRPRWGQDSRACLAATTTIRRCYGGFTGS